MKLPRLEGKTTTYAGEAKERAAHASEHSVRRVEAMEGLAGDRERSLTQEVASIEALAVGAFAGEAKILEDARAVAGQLAGLGEAAGQLIDSRTLAGWKPTVDDSA